MNARIRRARGPALALALAVSMPSCLIVGIFDEDGDHMDSTRFEASRAFSFEVPVLNRSRLRLEGVSGSIEISGDPAATTVTITGERTVGSESASDAERHLDDLEVVVRELSAEVEVRTVQPRDTRGRRYEVDYRITLPTGFRVVATQVNGIVEIERIDGSADIANVNGNVLLRDLAADTEVNLTNGNIIADVDLPQGGDIGLQVVNGNVDLRVQANASAEFFAQVTNGSISLHNLPLQSQTGTSRSIRGTLGSGAGSIDVTTVNGNIVVTGT